MNSVSELLNLQLLTVMLHQSFLLLVLNITQVVCSHLVLELELLNLSFQSLSLRSNLIDDPLDVSFLINELLVGNDKHFKSTLMLVILLLVFGDLILEVSLLLKSTLTLGFGHLSLHLLDLVLRTVKELLLPLLLSIKFVETCL